MTLAKKRHKLIFAFRCESYKNVELSGISLCPSHSECKNLHDSLCVHAKFGRDRATHAGVRLATECYFSALTGCFRLPFCVIFSEIFACSRLISAFVTNEVVCWLGYGMLRRYFFNHC